MYRAWCRKRHMQLTEMPGDFMNGSGGLPLLLISGFGAHRVLELERGLHVLELADDDRTPARATARVSLAVAPLGNLSAKKLRSALKDALLDAGQPNSIVRRYRDDAAPLVRDLVGGWRSGRFDAVLGGDFDLIAASRSS
jgi:ATP-dependent Clp protease ATP-binding subunit ClpC